MGLEPGISGSQGKRPNHSTTLPPCLLILEELPHPCPIKKVEIVANDYNNADLYFEMTFSLPSPSSLLK